MGIPILGICYGMQLIGKLLGGSRPFGEKGVRKGEIADGSRRATLQWFREEGKFFHRLDEPWRPGQESALWVSCHRPLKKHPRCRDEHPKRKIYGLQFHPEVIHTPRGIELLRNFLFRVCGCSRLWTMQSFLEQISNDLRRRIGREKVICALSGGVDSTVVALLLHKGDWDRLQCILWTMAC